MTQVPPRLARLLLRLVVPNRDREYVVRDLAEEFDALLAAGESTSTARRWYWRQVLASVPSSVARRRRRKSGVSAGRLVTLDSLSNDLRYTIRSIYKRPFFSAVTIVTLALGVGAMGGMFTVVNNVLIKPLDYDDPGRLVGVWHKAPGFGMRSLNQTAASYVTHRDENRSFEGIALWDNARVTVTGIDEPEQVRVVLMTHNAFPLLRVQPMLGRVFTLEDDAVGANGTIIFGNGYWRRRFGSDPEVIGRTVTVSGRPFEIVGVMSPEFSFLSYDIDAFLPMRLDEGRVSGLFGFTYQSFARLQPGVTVEQANADVARMIPLTLQRFPNGVSAGQLDDVGFGANVHPLKADIVGDITNLLWVLLASVGILLLIACANVANLFLVRAEGRQREIAVRSALGAGRPQLVRQLMLETVSLALLGGVAGLGLAWAGLRFLVARAPSGLPRVGEIGIDGTAVFFTLAISVTAGVLFGLYPLLRFNRLDLIGSLKDSGRSGQEGRERHRARNSLVVVQLSLALLLLVGAGLMVRSVQAMMDIHPGFERPEELLALRVEIPRALVSDDDASLRAHEQILERISNIPGVTSAGISSSVTLDGWDDNNAIYVEAFPVGQDAVPPIRAIKFVSPNYFETMENRPLAGRSVSWSDVRNSAPVVVVTENLARDYWNDPADAIGKRIAEGPTGPWYEIVGVVGDVYDDGVGRDPASIVFWPISSGSRSYTIRSLGYAIRSQRLDDPSFLGEVQRAVWSVNPNLAVANVRTLEELLERSMARTSFTLILLGVAAAMAVLLGLVGVYGVISYAVARRTREIGLRMALGASARDVRRQVLKQGMVLAGIGVAAGLTASVALTRLMSALLYGVSPTDPVTYVVVASGLIGITLLASYLPARRAMRVDPMEALR